MDSPIKKDRFALTSSSPLKIIPYIHGVDYLRFLDFEVKEAHDSNQEILLKFELNKNGSRISKKEWIMTFENFNAKYILGKQKFTIDHHSDLFITVGIFGEDKVFYDLDTFPHLNNIEYFDYQFGYELGRTDLVKFL